MKWRPKDGKPLTFGCNAWLGHAFVAEAGRCGEWRRTAALAGLIEVDEAEAAEVALELAAQGAAD